MTDLNFASVYSYYLFFELSFNLTSVGACLSARTQDRATAMAGGSPHLILYKGRYPSCLRANPWRLSFILTIYYFSQLMLAENLEDHFPVLLSNLPY